MSNELLLPNRYKLIGWFLLIPAAILHIIIGTTSLRETFEIRTKVFGIYSQFFQVFELNIVPTILGVLFIVGAMMVGFSREKKEDEFIARVRLSSLVWAVWVNYSLLFLCFLFIHDLAFLSVMIYNMFTVLIIFIVRFNYILYKNSKSASNEK